MTEAMNPQAGSHVDIRFRTEKLEAPGLPDIAYPIRPEFLETAIGDDGNLPFGAMLAGLQERSAEGSSDWRGLEPAIARLAALLAPDDPRNSIEVGGDTWWIEIGPVDLAGPIVTVQRENVLIAAIAARAGDCQIFCARGHRDG